LFFFYFLFLIFQEWKLPIKHVLKGKKKFISLVVIIEDENIFMQISEKIRLLSGI
jgi:hypothetical protein